MVGNLFLDGALASKFRHGIDRLITQADAALVCSLGLAASLQLTGSAGS
jgi:hypothetical protein